MTHLIIQNDAFFYLTKHGLHVQLIIADPLYDWDASLKNKFHTLFMDTAKEVLVYSPPENLWQPCSTSQETLHWVKPISTKNTSKHYSRFVEVVQDFYQDESQRVWNTHLHWYNYVNVLTDKVDSKEHPWRKPLSQIMRFIEIHTHEGDWVLDPFAGCGVVMEACMLLNRNSVSIDISEESVVELKRKRDEYEKRYV